MIRNHLSHLLSYVEHPSDWTFRYLIFATRPVVGNR